MLFGNLLPFCLILPTMASTAALPTQDGGSYRALFDDGVRSLGAAKYERAAESFRAAGRQAPDALIWRSYLRKAEEEAGSAEAWLGATPAPTMELLAWEPVEVAVRSDLFARMSATGERILYGHPEAALVDVMGGGLVARLRFRSGASDENGEPDGACRWDFDTSGRVVVGAGGRWGRGVGLDVRDALTGRPLELEGAATLNVNMGARFTWFGLGEEPPDSDFQGTVDLRASEGTLRCELVPEAEVDDRGSRRVTLSATGSLAMLRDQANTIEIIDRRSGQTVLGPLSEGYDSWFSPDGMSVFLPL